MVPRVIADYMFRRSSLDKLRVVARRLPHHEKRRANLKSIEKIEQAGRVFGMRAVIERQGDDGLVGYDTCDHVSNLRAFSQTGSPTEVVSYHSVGIV